MTNEISKPNEMDRERKKDGGPSLRFKFEKDEATGRNVLKGYELSDGTILEKGMTIEGLNRFLDALKRTTGSEDLSYAVQVISLISSGIDKDSPKERFDYTALMLGTLRPQDEVEALLLGQFLTLQDAGMKCLSQFNNQDSFYHKERFLMLATKVFAQTNAVMQTLVKYRSGGKQVIQIMHIHNEGQAVVNQSVSD